MALEERFPMIGPQRTFWTEHCVSTLITGQGFMHIRLCGNTIPPCFPDTTLLCPEFPDRLHYPRSSRMANSIDFGARCNTGAKRPKGPTASTMPRCAALSPCLNLPQRPNLPTRQTSVDLAYFTYLASSLGTWRQSWRRLP